MPTVRARVFVTLKPSLLDAQGRVVQTALGSLGYGEVDDVRIGKLIELRLACSAKEADSRVREMCDRLLANPVIENYRVEIEAADGSAA